MGLMLEERSKRAVVKELPRVVAKELPRVVAKELPRVQLSALL